MVTYNRNKKGVRDDRISSIQIRWVKKGNCKGKREMSSRKRAPRLLCVEHRRNTPCFLSWISGATKENTKTGWRSCHGRQLEQRKMTSENQEMENRKEKAKRKKISTPGS